MHLLRWSGAVAILAVIAALYCGAVLRAADDLQQLERLARRVEHAPSISPDMAASIVHALDNVRQQGGHSDHGRRDAAIGRVLNAVRTKERITDLAAL
jgi:hypothetical protein